MKTIKEVAQIAGVAVSTVSYVINDSKFVKPATRARVEKAISELNYRPRMTARSLKTKRTHTIGIIVPDISNPFFIDIIYGIESVLQKDGYDIILCNTHESEDAEVRYLENLLNKDVDGLVFISTGRNHNAISNTNDTPLVIVDRKVSNNFSSVLVDNTVGGQIATQHLIDCYGKEEIYLITGPLLISTYFDRMIGYRKALSENNIQYDEKLVYECNVSLEGGFEAMEKILSSGKIPRKVFIANDMIALGAMKAIIKRGILIPEQIAIVGYDDISTASIVTPELTTIHQPSKKIGCCAADLLMQQIRDPFGSNQQIMLMPTLVIRNTT